jgi:choline dehydrogenase-like flavoprotein
MATHEKVDVVIVGAGAAGSVYAAMLTRAGKKVVLLEQGPDWKVSDLISSDIWARRIRGSGPPTILEGRHTVGRIADTGWGTGGAALHYSANFPRLLPSDFTMKSDHGRGLDWPISYADLAPYYDRVAREIGVSGDARAEERWRPAGEPYPMPPLKTFRHGEVWLPGFKAAGLEVAPGAVAINSTDYRGRPACIHDGWCGAGCPTGALANPQVTWLGEARRRGAEVRPFSYVTRVLTAAQGNRVTGVEYFDDKKERQVQEANVVVLAAFPSQNPRLMLNSATDKHPKGLANASGLLGKYMMAHAGATVSALFDEDLQNYFGSFGYQFVSYDRHPKTSRKSAFGSTFWTTGARRSRPMCAESPTSAPICSAGRSTTSSSTKRAGSPVSRRSARNCR